jgi:hypothetical protein
MKSAALHVAHFFFKLRIYLYITLYYEDKWMFKH